MLAGDRPLLDAFRRGEREALTRVYREYAPMIAAFLARGFTFQSKGRLLQFRGYHQPFDQDNALQETFVRAFSDKARHSYDGLSPYKSYLMTITRNWVLSEFRRKEVAMSQLICDAENSASDELPDRLDNAAVAQGRPGPSAETELLSKELSLLYERFVSELRDPDQCYFRARYERRLGQSDAGKGCGLSHMQARTLEKKLRRRFVQHLQTGGYLDGYDAERLLRQRSTVNP